MSGARKRFGWVVSAALLSLGGCASTQVTRVGQLSVAPLPPTESVGVYASEFDVKGSYDVLGIVEYSDPGTYLHVALDAALPSLKDKARSIGANALIIDGTLQTVSGVFTRSLYVRARAIRLPAR